MPIIEKTPSYMGVDPGKNGGIAVLLPNGEIQATKMPDTMADLAHWITTHGKNCIAIIEQVGGFAGKAHPGSHMFNFGKGVGHLEMALYLSGISTESVPPQRWQRELHVSNRKKGEGDRVWKNRLKSLAQKLFPSESVTLKTADALLIAEYCRRKHKGTLG